MTGWSETTFVFISTNQQHSDGGVEDRWLPVMRELKAQGATVRFLCLMGSPVGERARAEGIGVDPYILDKWNLWRSRSRLRKYLIRYHPICVHSTGLEADLLLRAAVPFLPGTHICTTIPCTPQCSRRRGFIDAIMRRFDERKICLSSAVFVECHEVAEEVRAAGVPERAIVMDPPADTPDDQRDSVERHIQVYMPFVAGRRRR